MRSAAGAEVCAMYLASKGRIQITHNNDDTDTIAFFFTTLEVVMQIEEALWPKSYWEMKNKKRFFLYGAENLFFLKAVFLARNFRENAVFFLQYRIPFFLYGS